METLTMPHIALEKKINKKIQSKDSVLYSSAAIGGILFELLTTQDVITHKHGLAQYYSAPVVV